MSSAEETLRKLLKNHSQSVTQARLTVFRALLDQEPLSMHELVERCQVIDRASVYRAVELFERLDIVQRMYTGWKYRIELTDKFTAHHHHLTCTMCGKTVAINEHELEQFIAGLAAQHQFQASAHQIEIQGLCALCTQNNQV